MMDSRCCCWRRAVATRWAPARGLLARRQLGRRRDPTLRPGERASGLAGATGARRSAVRLVTRLAARSAAPRFHGNHSRRARGLSFGRLCEPQ